MKKQEGLALSHVEGFTIIELIVVIAIIAVLAAIVITNVTQYMNKGKDAAIKGDLASLVVKGTAYYDNHSASYTGFCTDTAGGAPIKVAMEASNVGGVFTCNVKSDNSAWCACSPLHSVSAGSSDTFCVDSTGNKKTLSTGCATRCPVGGKCD